MTFVSEEAFYYSYFDDIVEGQSFTQALLRDARTEYPLVLNALSRFKNIYMNEMRLDQPDLIFDIVLRSIGDANAPVAAAAPAAAPAFDAAPSVVPAIEPQPAMPAEVPPAPAPAELQTT